MQHPFDLTMVQAAVIGMVYNLIRPNGEQPNSATETDISWKQPSSSPPPKTYLDLRNDQDDVTSQECADRVGQALSQRTLLQSAAS